MQPKIGIILINYKDYAKRFIGDCRDSFRQIDYPKDKYIVYIVDNATSAESQAYLKEMYPEAIVLPNAENSGWGGGNNVGIERAFADGCADIVLANLDVIVEKDWLKELVAAAYANHNPSQPPLTLRGGDRSDPPLRVRGGRGSYDNRSIGIVQSKLLLWPVGADGIVKINSIGNQIHFLGFGFAKGNGEPDKIHNPSQPPLTLRGGELEDIPYSSGASMYVKGEVFRKVGLCNPEFFMYHDDMELCLKAKMAGYRVVLAPKSVMWHKYEFGRSIMQVYYMERNRLLTVLYFYKIPTLLILLPPFVAMEIALLFASIVGKYFKPKVRGWGYLLSPKNWSKIQLERQKIQALRTISDRELTRDFSGTIMHQHIMNPILKYIANPLFNVYWQVAKRVIIW